MMIHQNHSHSHRHPTVHIPPWPLVYRYPPSDEDVEAQEEEEEDSGGLSDPEYPDPSVDLYSSDEFRMYEFKIRRCARGRSHDWTDCPYAHPGEKARRRDPRKFHYSGSPCPEYKKGCCKKGDSCEYAHGVFECWLHPARYRTQPCKDGTGCRRRVCFFSHTPEQLRILSPRSTLNKVDSYDGSPMRRLSKSSSSRIMSPPMSPGGCSEYGSPPVSPDGLAMWLRKMRLAGGGGGGRGVVGARGLLVGVSGGSMPSTPTTRRSAMVNVEEEAAEEEEMMMMPDFGWVSELIK
ncbi:putative zinc finger CCCH domain-containing protein 2 [Iris pallida]|uniref:Zinc finger CCCH domain-containing protein 2 n=1 Tax=Iris pallida TaxID=29817 RepID=A0AAX6EYK0_IRIPA|nr:putative zinc finger CCCH domain-containing protein 2 [Iris pallida]